MSEQVIDNFLMPYAAGHDGLEKEMEKRFKSFRHLLKKDLKESESYLKAQYIIHRVFKAGGLIHKYLKRGALNFLNPEERNYLEILAAHPWKFSFSEIIESPSENFYRMEDVFSGESFLLYSPNVTTILNEQAAMLWFNLISFNGACWQSYGPIVAYQSFDIDDIFFFATELNPAIESEEDILKNVEENPVPYMMLLTGSRFPLAVHKGEPLIMTMAEFTLNDFRTDSLNKDFKVEYSHGVFCFTPTRFTDSMPLATAYYDEQRKLLLLSAQTDRSFQILVELLNRYGIGVVDDPQIRVHMVMLSLITKILKRDIQLDPYEKLFRVKSTREDRDNLNKLNEILRLALPDINANKNPDVESLAKKAGIDVETARDLLEQVIGRINYLKSD
jgi:hypothetical protein